MRFDPDGPEFFRKQGRRYQSSINAVLRRYMELRKHRANQLRNLEGDSKPCEEPLSHQDPELSLPPHFQNEQEDTPLSIRAIAVIKRESTVDGSTHARVFYAPLSLLSEAGKEYGAPRNFSGFEELGAVLKREARVTHQELTDSYPRYERGDQVRLVLTLENEESIRNLGFNPQTT